jgi:protein gp37
MIFSVDMGDLFASCIPDEWVEAVLEVVRACPQHTFQFLTKSPQNLAHWNPFPVNAWVGATVDWRARLDLTLDALRQVDAPVRFVSFEPLLEDMEGPDLEGIGWVIIGALTGNTPRQPDPRWVRSLIASASDAGAAVFLKRNLVWQDRMQDFPQETGQLALL